MNILDLLLSIFLLMGLVRGLFKGFFTELAGLLALIGGIYAAIHFSDAIYSFLNVFIDWNERYLTILAFAITFFIVALLISLAGSFLTKMVHMVALGIVNRLAGGALGLLKMAFLASIFIMFIERFEIFDAEESTKEESVLYEPVRILAPAILPTIIEEVKEGDLFETSSEAEEASES
ncbi:CvpA family protein [Salinimicrobium oceani]|uniref:CvpA family protein n=1 Tax=Salinimicrobium oceani TaxID=2722702 RepID=A0ABX1D2S9_9FLAO|nr:CvpA family protein [Salinimicrobium oceani]NJW52856.1 CvpA family protein [Salinimicrobium oceani]